jgi:EAL domain-containing protein (putative c-di-GMP-specific phosphodiesterase class I)
MHGLDVWVNISGRHLANGCVVDDVRAALQLTGLAPSRLILEITETVRVDSPQAVDHLRQLSALGVRLALDDFGTGHTSISQLLNLPISILKLDGSLISGLTGARRTAQDARPLYELVIEMARSLGLTVVAEGVERPEHVASLLAGHCDRAQGYLFSRPLEPDQVPAWAARTFDENRIADRS